jgi:class 3 adenylate cyclase
MSALTCGACGTGNPAGARFCMSCGARLERRCPSCGTVVPPEARFCMACGTALEAAPTGPAGGVQPPEERRRVTVLFADLSGYTAFAERMDPEAVKTLVDGALHRLGEEVERYGGTVDKYIGDNVMALFGAPVAHEDDAERAVRAALGMQAAMGEVNQRLPEDVHFDLRVGINTGEVLAGAIGRAYTVMGDTVNVASRLQSAARPGSVWVGEATMRATSQAVRYHELEPLELRGKSRPVPAWEATGLITEHALRRAGWGGGETPLIGRDDELGTLESVYERVVARGGHIS